MVAHIAGLVCHLAHENDISLFNSSPKARNRVRQLIAENQNNTWPAHQMISAPV